MASQLAIDDQQLRNAESNTGMALSSPAAGVYNICHTTYSKVITDYHSPATATPANNVVDPTLPLPVTSS